MGIFDVLYSVIINPLILLYDVIFSITLCHIRHVGWSIVFLSIIISTLVLPLYNRADEIQERENKKKESLKKWENHIKKSFKGDERFMILQTYYRQNDYKPYQTLRGAIPLLLQIPFFISAYRYLSGVDFLNGCSFGPINDLSVPDHMLKISGYYVNLMPILMTVINILSGLIYSRTSLIRDKVQLFIIAFVFLVLLYNSPSGLVLYWTCNNIYSLCKNVINRFIIRGKRETKDLLINNSKSDKDITLLFVAASLFLSFLVGSYIPEMLMIDSVEEFIDFNFLTNPAFYIINSLCMSIGLFFVWGGVFFYLARKKGRLIIASLVSILSIVGFINYAITPFDSNMSMFLSIDNVTKPTTTLVLQSIAVIIASIGLVYFLVKYKKKAFSFIILFTFIPFCFWNIFLLNRIYREAADKIVIIKKYDNYPEIHLGKNGNNVVVIMMDRMLSYYVPFLMNENSELKEQFDGFTYYPNCVSYGIATNVGTPALFGGYEYTPEKINERKDELLKEKQNEALKVMPVLFGEHGYDVTVGNPPYANYGWIPDVSIYDEYPFIYKYNTGAKMNPDNIYYSYEDVIKRNLVCYGIYRSAPIFLQSSIYDDSCYHSLTVLSTKGIGMSLFTSLSESQGISELFFNDYFVLDNLSNITIVDENANHFNMFSNHTTHEAVYLKEPDYELNSFVDNTEYNNSHTTKTTADGDEIQLYGMNNGDYKLTADSVSLGRVMMYYSNMATMITLGKWFDYLRENDLYDNTRIIIVSDHGYSLNFKSDLVYNLTFENGTTRAYDMLAAHSTLLVKDYNSKGFVTDDTFMTNADVPMLAAKDIINDPKNPFTGNSINTPEEKEVNIIYTSTWHINDNNGYTFNKSHWFSVHDDIFNNENWNYLGAY